MNQKLYFVPIGNAKLVGMGVKCELCHTAEATMRVQRLFSATSKSRGVRCCVGCFPKTLPA